MILWSETHHFLQVCIQWYQYLTNMYLYFVALNIWWCISGRKSSKILSHNIERIIYWPQDGNVVTWRFLSWDRKAVSLIRHLQNWHIYTINLTLNHSFILWIKLLRQQWRTRPSLLRPSLEDTRQEVLYDIWGYAPVTVLILVVHFHGAVV